MMNEIFDSLTSWFNGMVSSLPRLLAVAGGILWVYLEPTLPYALICVLAVFIDFITAWRLNRRIRIKYPNAGADGKLKSQHMSKMIADLLIVWLCIILANVVDNHLLAHLGGLHLGQYVAAIFVLCTAVSILENESSCNGSTWAKLLQKVVADKVSRHIDVNKEELEKIIESAKTKTDDAV